MPSGFGFNMGFTAVFERATILWDLVSGKPLTVYRSDQKPETWMPPVSEDGYYGEIDYFLGCIERNEKPCISTPEESRDAVALALAEKESAGEDRRILIQ